MVYRIIHGSIFRKQRNITRHDQDDKNDSEENNMKISPTRRMSFKISLRRDSEFSPIQDKRRGLLYYLGELRRQTVLILHGVIYAMLRALALVFQSISSITEASYDLLKDMSVVFQHYFFKSLKFLQICILRLTPNAVYIFFARCIALYAPEVKYRKCKIFILERVPSRYIKKASFLYVKFYSIPDQVNHMCRSFKENGCSVTLFSVAKQLIQAPLKLVTLVAMLISFCLKTLERVTKVGALRRKKSMKREKSK